MQLINLFLAHIVRRYARKLKVDEEMTLDEKV